MSNGVMISYSLVSIGSHTAETRPCCKTRRNEPLENLCTQESKAQSLLQEDHDKEGQTTSPRFKDGYYMLLWMC